MNFRTILAHAAITGHSRFEGAIDGTWVCLDCPGASPTTCQQPISAVSLCSLAVVPGTLFCPAHSPKCHLLSLLDRS